jgi:hypothetical protein
MAMLSLMPPHLRCQVAQSILGKFASEGDRSGFGLMNAVTATARDTADPELRWRLEELGGGVAALRRPQMPPDSEARDFLDEEALELAGQFSSSGRRMAAS